MQGLSSSLVSRSAAILGAVFQTAIVAVVEQDLQLIFRLQELCSDYGLKLIVARSPEEATLYLRGVGIYANRMRYPLPGLIVLDTESSGAGDLAMLAWLREHPQFRSIPVGLLALEPPHKVHVACAIDPDCFIIDRNSLWELPTVAWQIFFPWKATIDTAGPGTRTPG
jgi:CheY-like chemotaxis protein